MALEFEADTQRRKGRLEWAWMRQVEEDCMKFPLGVGKLHFAAQSELTRCPLG